jgi:multiple sugar transport system substrate-binding protein
MAPRLTRRSFLKAAGASAAGLAAGANFLPGLSRAFAAPARQETVNVTFGGWGGAAEDEGVQAAIQVFQEENPGITVEWQHTPVANDYNNVLLTNFAAGTAPDTSFIIADGYETLRQQGLLMDITDLIASDDVLGQENYFIEPQESNRCADADGRWHGIGSCWVAPHLYYNAEAFDEIGVTPPGFKDEEIWDWDTFVEISKQLTVDVNGRHPDDAGFDPDNIERWAVQWPLWWIPIASAIYSNGGAFIQDGLYALDSPEALDAMQRLSDLVYVHHVAPRTASMSELGMSNTQMIDNGRLVMAVDGSWALSWMNPSLASVPLSTGALPKMEQPATLMQAHFHSVISTTTHPDEAWQWVRFLATPFYQTQFCKIGLWIPSQTGLMTEEGLATWITEGIHPANYVDFVTEYLPAYGVAVRLPPGTLEAAANFLNPAYDALNNGTPAADVFPDAVAQANAVVEAATAAQ